MCDIFGFATRSVGMSRLAVARILTGKGDWITWTTSAAAPSASELADTEAEVGAAIGS